MGRKWSPTVLCTADFIPLFPDYTDDSFPGTFSLSSSKSPGLLASSSSSSSSSSMTGSNHCRPQSSPVLSGTSKSQPGYAVKGIIDLKNCGGANLRPRFFCLCVAALGAADRGTAEVKAASKASRTSWSLTAPWASLNLWNSSSHSGEFKQIWRHISFAVLNQPDCSIVPLIKIKLEGKISLFSILHQKKKPLFLWYCSSFALCFWCRTPSCSKTVIRSTSSHFERFQRDLISRRFNVYVFLSCQIKVVLNFLRCDASFSSVSQSFLLWQNSFFL